MTSPAQPPPPAEAQLIRRAREAAGLSPETAAARMVAGVIGGARWRQIENGYRSDSRKPVVAKGATLAHMAMAVGVTADRLEEAGRPDAAEVLREIDVKSGKRNAAPSDLPDSSARLVDERWSMIKGLLELAGRDLNRTEYRELIRRVDEHFQQQPEWMPPVEEAPPRGQQARKHG